MAEGAVVPLAAMTHAASVTAFVVIVRHRLEAVGVAGVVGVALPAITKSGVLRLAVVTVRAVDLRRVLMQAVDTIEIRVQGGCCEQVLVDHALAGLRVAELPFFAVIVRLHVGRLDALARLRVADKTFGTISVGRATGRRFDTCSCFQIAHETAGTISV